jgi:hypothetical protein
MARKLYYKILNDGINRLTDLQWEEILKLQHWYNSEFVWTAGRLGLKMFAVFPNGDHRTSSHDDFYSRISKRSTELRSQGLTENQIILRLENEGYVIVKKGGYLDECLASGFTRVAGNEFNAYLVCDFILKVSRVAPESVITLYDEGEFIKPKTIKVRQGNVIIPVPEKIKNSYFELMVSTRHVFAVVDSAKYDKFPRYQSTVTGFNDLTPDERTIILRNWNWLGFENSYDINGDDIQGFDLNKKVDQFDLEYSDKNS